MSKSKGKKNIPISEADPKTMLTHLESNNVIDSAEEYDRIMSRLKEFHKQTCIKTLLEQKRIDAVTKDIAQIQAKNVDIKKELDSVKEEYDTSNNKLLKLQKLSQQLTTRVKEMDLKSAEDIRAEKENRFTMSSNFQNTIKDISVKLEELARRRESIIRENVRLKTVLKEYLEEFDKYKDTMVMSEEGAEGEAAAEEEADSDEEGEGGAPPSLGLEGAVAAFVQASADGSAAEDLPEAPRRNGDITVVPLVAPEDEPRVVELPPVKTEEEILVAKLSQLQNIELALRGQTSEYMKIFESFQVKLSGSNKAFQDKQNSIDKLTKEIKQLEKDMKQYASKIGNMDASNKTFQAGNDSLLREKEKLSKGNEKYQTLIATFMKDIEELEAKIAE